MPNSHSCSRGKVWRRAHRQSGKRIPGACVKKSKSIKSVRKMKSKSRKPMRKSKKSKSRSKKSKKSKSRKMKKSKSRKMKKSKSRSKKSMRKYHGFLDDLKNAAKKAANTITGAATKAAGALVPSGIPYLSSAAKKAVKGAGEAAHFDGYYAIPTNRAAGASGPRR